MDAEKMLEYISNKYGIENASGYFIEQKTKAFIDGAKWENKKIDIIIEHLENCLKNPISFIGNIDYQKGYIQSTKDLIFILQINKYEK